IFYCAYALGILFTTKLEKKGYWYESELIQHEQYNIGKVMIIFMTILASIFNLGQARSAASFPSTIDNNLDEGIKKSDLIGNIKFSNVTFSYPSRSDIEILKIISFNVKQDETIALVGSSGSDKSRSTSALDNESKTIVQDALDCASQDRTTIVIAHRLSTIRNADKIIVMQKGEIIEEGNHELLMNNQSSFFFGCSRETLTKRFRQDISYFDDLNNNTGALSTCLSTEASTVQSATGIRLEILLQSFCSLVGGLIIGSFLESRLMTGFARKCWKETIQNIRTVVQLTKEDYFYEEYSKVLEIPSSIKRAHNFAFCYAITASVIFFVMAVLFLVGGYLIDRNKLSFEDVLITPDYNKAIGIRSPNILFFDEATSTLDNKSESKISKVLEDVGMNRTSSIIAHRLSTIQNSDKIIVIDKGQMKEEGTHNELLKSKGIICSKMVTSQKKST
ncbi:unnamed protein product, partial [Adineta steineri]